MELVPYAEKVVSLCQKLSECEVCIEDKHEKIITIQKDEIRTEREKHEITMGLRVVVGKKKGFKATTLPVPADEVVKTGIKIARHAVEDPAWDGFPSPRPVPAVKGIYDQKIADIDIKGLVEISEGLFSLYPDVFMDGRVTTSVTERVLVNSQGVTLTDKSTKEYIFVSCHPRTGSASAAMDWAVSRCLDIDCEQVAETAARTVLDSSKAHAIPHQFKGELLVSENVCAQIFMNSLAAAVNAEVFRRGLTPFTGRIHQKITATPINVVDTGVMERGVCSFPWDREGTPCQYTPIIEDGILCAILHNQYTAHQFNTVSTGNAVGTAMTEPVVGITNLVITPGTLTTEKIIENMEKGVYVTGFSGATDVTTGNFSGVVPHGYYIEKGEIKFPARFLISGNSFSCLQDEVLVGKGQKATLEGMYAVPFMVESVNIVPHNQ